MRLLIILCLVAAAMADTSPESKVKDGSNKLSGKLFDVLAKQQPDKSVVLSGFSAITPVVQLGLGSVGPAHDEIIDAIGMKSEGDQHVRMGFEVTYKNLNSLKSVELKAANSIYFPKGTKLKKSFAEMSRDVFKSETQDVDFSNNVEAAAKINGWVEDHTNHRIKDLVSQDDLKPSTEIVVVNAIYFQGAWRHTFDNTSTADQDFHVSKGKTVKVPTMYQNAPFKFAHSPDLQAKVLELPFEGNDVSFIVVLPDEVEGLNSVLQKVKIATNLNKAVSELKFASVDVSLPKFELETEVDLKALFQNAGVEKIFGSESNLKNVFESSMELHISKAIQKAFLKINEVGVEAAVASAITGLGSALPGHSEEFRADRPFYFELRTNSLTLFSGVYYG